jgi:hypothetical protein
VVDDDIHKIDSSVDRATATDNPDPRMAHHPVR